jgi:tetratricopeptide (TPR) repeat protein
VAAWRAGNLSIRQGFGRTKTSLGPVPKTLRPIFRDREDFSGGHSLTEATIEALDSSAALIVLCSTVSAGRPAVNEEVRLFRSRHPNRPVIPVIVEGTWPENLPPALRYELEPDGTITDRPITILGPDLRDGKDGKSLGLAKTVAGLTGLGTDDLVRRAEHARKRRNQFWAALAGLFLLLAVAATSAAIYAWQQLRTNEAFLEATLKQATEIVDEAVAQAEKFYVPRSATIAFLGKAEGLFDVMGRYGRPTPELRYRQAWMLIQFARNYAILGDTRRQFERAADASRLLGGLARERPDDLSYQEGLAAAYTEVGKVQVAQGDLTAALKSYSDSLAIFGRLAKADPNEVEWQRALSLSYEHVGAMQQTRGNLRAALESYTDSLSVRGLLSESDPTNTQWQRDLAVTYELVGDVQIAQGDLNAAQESFSDSHAIFERVAKSDLSNTEWQRDLAVSYVKVGDVQKALGDLKAALESFSNSLAIAARLAEADPSNGQWQRDLAVSYQRIGEVQVVRGNLEIALKSYADSLAIRDRLAKSDPGNTGWQRDLAVSYAKLGSFHGQNGNTAKAQEFFGQGRKIIIRLTQLSPDNAEWTRDLASLDAETAEFAKGTWKPKAKQKAKQKSH